MVFHVPTCSPLEIIDPILIERHAHAQCNMPDLNLKLVPCCLRTRGKKNKEEENKMFLAEKHVGKIQLLASYLEFILLAKYFFTIKYCKFHRIIFLLEVL